MTVDNLLELLKNDPGFVEITLSECDSLIKEKGIKVLQGNLKRAFLYNKHQLVVVTDESAESHIVADFGKSPARGRMRMGPTMIDSIKERDVLIEADLTREKLPKAFKELPDGVVLKKISSPGEDPCYSLLLSRQCSEAQVKAILKSLN